MSVAVLISIRPEYVCKILSGEKTVEVRKRIPDLKLPYMCYVYCTKGGAETTVVKGTVCGAFWCVGVQLILPPYKGKEQGTCLSAKQIHEYAGTGAVYGLDIACVNTFEKPLAVSDFCGLSGKALTRPPQSWCYVAGK